MPKSFLSTVPTRFPGHLRLPLIAAGLFAAAAFSQTTPVIPAGPWVDYFNKKDLTDWAQIGNPPWSIANGVLQTKGGSAKTYLIWKKPLKDFELEIKYKLSATTTNSGIQVRSQCQDPTKTAPDCGGTHLLCGVQLDVAQNYSGKLFEECKEFLVFDGQNIENCRRTFKVGEWTTTSARLVGDKISLWLNGTHCLDYTFTNQQHITGSIFALQSHPPYSLIEWEYIKVRDLAVVTDARRTPAKTAGSATVSKSVIHYSIPESGSYSLRLLDANGVLAGERTGTGPVLDGKWSLESPGIYFLEVHAAGTHSRHTLHNF